MKPIVYFDMDGVLADFDERACKLLNTTNPYKWQHIYGDEAFWARLNHGPYFWAELKEMPGIMHVWNAVRAKHPVAVLTALSPANFTVGERQKREWVKEHLGPNVEVRCCFTLDKPKYCRRGDILIDDRALNQKGWEENGGRFILHHNAVETWCVLKTWGVI
jgi:5'(3')-deoxyribonucleotidase